MLAVGQERREAVPVFLLRRIEGRHRLGRAAASRDPVQDPAGVWRKHDHVRRTPVAAARARRVAQHVGAPSGRGNRLQLGVREEANPAAVRRPEWQHSAVGVLEPARRHGIDRPHPQLRRGLRDGADDERDHRAVRRNRHAGRIRIQVGTRRRQHGEPRDVATRCWLRSGPERRGDARGQHNAGHRRPESRDDRRPRGHGD